MEIIAFLRAFRFAEASENSIFDCSVPFLVSERRHFCLPNTQNIEGNCQIIGGNIMVRTGAVAIVVTSKSAAVEVQTVLSAYGDIIVGRMGVPNHKTGRNVIALIVEGSVEKISAMTGNLGRIEDVTAKSVLTPAEQ